MFALASDGSVESYVLLDYCSIVLLLISSPRCFDDVCDVSRFGKVDWPL